MTIENKNLFQNLWDYRFRFTLEKEGCVLTAREECYTGGPGEKVVVPFGLELPVAPGEYCLNVSMVLREDLLDCPAPVHVSDALHY